MNPNNPLANMTYDFFMGQLRLIAVGVITYLAGAGKLTAADASMATAILVPAGLIAGPWIWSIYRNIGMKLVPKDSVAIAKEHVLTTENPVGATALVGSDDLDSVAVKVVGSILLAFIIMSLAWTNPVFAQTVAPRKLTGNIVADFANAAKPAPVTATGSTSLDGALKNFGDGVQAVEKSIVDKAIADLNAAITDATNHNDNISLPCWKANLALVQSLPSQWPEPPTLPLGIALSIQIQRDLLNSITGNDVNSLKVACAALLGDQLKIVANVAALLGIRVATGGLF